MKLRPEIKKLIEKYKKSDDFKQLCDVVREFCEANKQYKLASCYCYIEMGTINFFFIDNLGRWNHPLSNALTDLSIKLAQDFPDEYTDVRQTGSWSICNTDTFMHVWGEKMKTEEEETRVNGVPV